MRCILHLSDAAIKARQPTWRRRGGQGPPQAARAYVDHIWQRSRTESTHLSFPGRRLLGIHPAEARRVEARARGGGWGGRVVTTHQ